MPTAAQFVLKDSPVMVQEYYYQTYIIPKNNTKPKQNHKNNNDKYKKNTKNILSPSSIQQQEQEQQHDDPTSCCLPSCSRKTTTTTTTTTRRIRKRQRSTHPMGLSYSSSPAPTNEEAPTAASIIIADTTITTTTTAAPPPTLDDNDNDNNNNNNENDRWRKHHHNNNHLSSSDDDDDDDDDIKEDNEILPPSEGGDAVLVGKKHPELTNMPIPQWQGRAYCTEASKQFGGIRLSDMVMGMKYATLAITDDKPGTLEKIGTTGPWHPRAIQFIVQDSNRFDGTTATQLKNEIHRPLSYLLQTYCDVSLDYHINVSGWWKHGCILDTQGYIAHNDNMIVLAYRATDSRKDWILNMDATMSPWRTRDIERGYSDLLSGINYLTCHPDHIIQDVVEETIHHAVNNAAAAAATVVHNNQNHHNQNPEQQPEEQPQQQPPQQQQAKHNHKRKGRVHTGFYNSFLSSVAAIRQYIDPLLADTSQPKTFYIVGHSLGGALAHLALAYFVLEYQGIHYRWNESPHRIVVVTAGSPRVYSTVMQHNIDTQLQRYKGIITNIRLVCDKDMIASVPLEAMGYAHCQKLVYITKDGHILINPNFDHVIPKRHMKSLLRRHPTIATRWYDPINTDNNSSSLWFRSTRFSLYLRSMLSSSLFYNDHDRKEKQQQEKRIRRLPRPVRNHMPESYLKPLMKLYHEETKYKAIPIPTRMMMMLKRQTTATTTTTTTTTSSSSPLRHDDDEERRQSVSQHHDR